VSNGEIGMRFSIDYTGGTVWEFKLATPADTGTIRDAVVAAGHPEAQVSEASNGFVTLRTKPLGLQTGGAAEGSIAELRTQLETTLGPIAESGSVTTVGPVVSRDLTQQALLLVVLGSIGILLWMTYRFRNLRFGLAALVALLHDVIVTIGIFAILGTVAGVEIDALFVTAMLTIIGFSVHDTIVVFDRIR
jgi:preprotein translocase subunit SecF